MGRHNFARLETGYSNRIPGRGGTIKGFPILRTVRFFYESLWYLRPYTCAHAHVRTSHSTLKLFNKNDVK